MATRKRYSKQFKLRMLQQSAKSATDVTRELGMMRNQLYKGQRELPDKGEDKAFRGPGRNAAVYQRPEVADLKKWPAQLEEENAILKKAGAYFAKDLRWSTPSPSRSNASTPSA